MSTKTPEAALRDAFVSGLSKITHDKRLHEQLSKRFDQYVTTGANPHDSAGTLYLEAAIKFDDPDPKYYAAIAVYEAATGGIPLSDRDVKHHPGKHRVRTAEFVEQEYNPFKTKTDGRLNSIEEQLKGADALLRVLSSKELLNAPTRKIIQELDDIKRGHARLDAVKSDDPAINEAKEEKRKKLDDRFKAAYRAAESLAESGDRERAIHARAIDDLNLQVGEHSTLLAKHSEDVAKIKTGSDHTGTIALIALGIGVVAGFVAFLIKVFIITPDRVMKETIRGVTVEHVVPSQFNGFWPALVVGIVAGAVVLVIAFIVGVFLAGRQKVSEKKVEKKNVSVNTTTGKPTFDQVLKGDTPTEPVTREPDSIDHVNSLLNDDTTPTTKSVPARV